MFAVQKRDIIHAGRKAALIVGAAMLMAVGFAFFTVALWIFLVKLSSALFAASIIGFVYLGLGLVIMMMFLARQNPNSSKFPHDSDAANTPPKSANTETIAEAFFNGVYAGARARKGV